MTTDIKQIVNKYLIAAENKIFNDADENDVAVAILNRELIKQMITSGIVGIYNAIRSDELFQRLDNDNKHHLFNALVTSMFFTTICETYEHLGFIIEPFVRLEIISITKKFVKELSALIKTNKYNFNRG